MGETILPDLILVHPGVAPRELRRFAPLWADDDVDRSPEGYREISSAFPGLRALCREELAALLPPPDPALAGRVRDWVDGLAHQWAFSEVFAVRDLDFWAFLRRRMIRWLHERMVERRVIEALAAREPVSLIAIGLDPGHRKLLRVLTDALDDRLRPEIAFLEPPAPSPRHTITQRRFRKLFFLLQDAWHGVQLLAEDIFVRRPKVLLISDARCWQRGRGGPHGRTTDVHLESVWREGRQRRLRLYYRADSYHPDVGAMTSGRLAPTYLRHFLFLLAQTSRGFWEVWRIHRQWRQLRERPEFRASLTFEGLSLDDLVREWLDRQLGRPLSICVRATRRESHFLRGLRPRVLLLTHEQEQNRPVLMAAKRLGIPTVGLQLRPYHAWDHAYVLPRADRDAGACLPDRLCVFSQEAKAFLVEQGGFDPSTVEVTGDPRRDGAAPDLGRAPESVARMRHRWGVEGDRRVIGVTCRPTETSEILEWLVPALRQRDRAFVLLGPSPDASAGAETLRRRVAVRDFHWLHALEPDTLEDWRGSIDALVTTSWPDAAECLSRRIPVILVDAGEHPPLAGVDPGGLIPRARSAEDLGRRLDDALAGPERLPAGEDWHRLMQVLYGPPDGRAAARVMDLIESLARDA
jgi:hypothetical protein